MTQMANLELLKMTKAQREMKVSDMGINFDLKDKGQATGQGKEKEEKEECDVAKEINRQVKYQITNL